ncbi:MAG: right-handed parallel beta-helix repeat-containing protein [Deltaproteobacteria bacterium]|nr:right-handed parallel beta-helix repeat-containing protein [Deltaproteobacteria bacterium]MBN2673382.1 right-handed parallel beta-helix repeat-containing protein [Deltaproteobacteria bacterium]
MKCLLCTTVGFIALMGIGQLGCNDKSKGTSDDHSVDTSPIPIDSDIQVEAVCESLAPIDVSSPTTIVGDGTSTGCTEASLRSAASVGGVIVFDCGAEPATISLTEPIVVTAETVIDGGGTVTLDGNGSTRILYLDSAYDQTDPRLTVQHLTFVNGFAPQGGDDTAMGGGAIYRDGGSLTVMDCVFQNNRAPSPGQDIAGGAIYAFGGGDTQISDSTFIGNSASNGGALGSLNGDVTIINSVFQGNRASGYDGNPGHGGCGGAVYQDGRDEVTSLCGVTIANNEAGAIGGAYFRVSNDDSGTMTVAQTTFDNNTVTPTDDGNAGGLYLQGLQLSIANSTVSRNRAFYNGGLWIHTCHAVLTNVTIAENTATGSNGGGLWLSGPPTGTLLNCTIANNHSIAEDQVAGAIFGAGLAIQNTVISGNTAMWTPGCSETHEDLGGNIQWPDGALCTGALSVIDPQLGELQDNGGATDTMVPAVNSPARGVGTNCPPTDQLGNSRSDPCTAGAVE